jgi:hypothetical protein
MTTDFRRVYATMLDEWMGCKDIRSLLRGDYPPWEFLSKGSRRNKFAFCCSPRGAILSVLSEQKPVHD